MNVKHISFRGRKRDKGHYQVAIVYAGRHRIEVTESPTGRNVYIHVNGQCVWPQS